ncbi:hypothetical protein EDD16DRAFT_1709609 [Pisolithus croceorrhizus]|nr:hypothetical protein EDD16DRAFT_1709609 [Pisolithus croceorrhizus]
MPNVPNVFVGLQRYCRARRAATTSQHQHKSTSAGDHNTLLSRKRSTELSSDSEAQASVEQPVVVREAHVEKTCQVTTDDETRQRRLDKGQEALGTLYAALLVPASPRPSR